MSLILEALKKIEADKSRRVKKADIAAAILLPDRRVRRKKILLISGLFLSAVLLFVGAGAWISYLLLANPQPVQPLQTVRSAPLPTAAPAPAVAAAEKPAEVVMGSVKQTLSETHRAVAVKPVVVAKVHAIKPIPRDSEIDEPASPSRTPRQPKQARKVSVDTAEPKANDSFKLTGIIWAEDGAKSRALVNGASLKEGDTVEGARIERIEPTRIVCSRDGKSFMVPVRPDID